MGKRLDRVHRAVPLVLGVVTLTSVGVLLAWNVSPRFFPARAHDFLAAFPLAMIAIAYLLYQSARRPPAKEFFKAILLAVAFLFGLRINSGQTYPRRLSSTTLPLRFSFLMCFWSLLVGRGVPRTNLLEIWPTLVEICYFHKDKREFPQRTVSNKRLKSRNSAARNN